jgi:dTDP-4-amino-4,6-dideoxygalactose transaminase
VSVIFGVVSGKKEGLRRDDPLIRRKVSGAFVQEKTLTSKRTGSEVIRQKPLAPWPYFAPDEIEAVVGVMQSGKVNQWTGQEVKSFEKEFAAYVGSHYAVALFNGTVALELALWVLGIGQGDEVITTSRTFIASASAAVMRGARPVCVDVDRESQNITAETIKAAITPRTKAIIAVHLAGLSCDMDPIMELAEAHGIKVIEDCAQAHGARYKGRSVGALGHIAAWSFCQDKILTTGGEGGMITTDDPTLWRRCWELKDHGKSYEAVFERQHPPGFRWLHESFGTNYRMTEMQAAIGRVILRKLDAWVEARRNNARQLTEALSRYLAIRIPHVSDDFFHSYYKYYCFVEPSQLREGWDRDKVMTAITAQGIPCFSGSCSEIYLEKAFQDADLAPKERLTVAKELGETSLMFLVHPTLTAEDIQDTVRAIHQILSEASPLR